MPSAFPDTPSFQRFFEAQAEGLRNFLYYKCGDVQQAEDLMQEAFIRLWQQRDKVEEAKAKSYLYTVANRLFLDSYKHQQVVLKFQKQEIHHIQWEDPGFQLEVEEFRERLEAAINALPEKSRIVFLMSRMEDKSYREIAEILGISQKAVEKRMHKALIELRKIVRKI